MWLESILEKLRGSSTDVGKRGERLAARHLRRQGYRILGRNIRNRYGEIDLLAEAPDRRTIVVVEVKTSQSREDDNDPMPPEVHVNLQKQRKLTALACQIARARRLTQRPIRFDVIGVDLPTPTRAMDIRHHPGAFELTV